jgi:hypothetical protein
MQGAHTPHALVFVVMRVAAEPSVKCLIASRRDLRADLSALL